MTAYAAREQQFPLERIAIDIVGPLPRMENGNEYIMVVTNYFTKWAEAYAVPDNTAQTVADKLLNEFVCRFGVPQCIHTDQGREFEGHLFARICEILEIEKTRTTPYRPQSDGLVERFNKTLQQMLSIFVNENRSDWDNYIPFLLMAYRSSQKQSTQCTPNLLMLLGEVRLPLGVIVRMPPGEKRTECPSEYVEWVRNSLENSYDFARENLQRSFARQKRSYHKNARRRDYPVGSWVWRWYPPPPQAHQKLGLRWTGPYFVVGRGRETLVQIQRDRESSPLWVHQDDLKPYKALSPPEPWV